MNKLDKIFEERLSDHSTTPTAAAWDRIEAGLSKKNSGIVWMRWAAVLVPATVVAALWLNKPVETPAIAQVPAKAEVQTSATIPAPAEQQETAVVAKPVKSEVTPRVATRQPQNPVIVNTAEPEPAALQPEAIAVEDVTIEPVEIVIEAPEKITEAQKPIVLVYTLESVVTPVPETEKPSTFERAVEFARTVKHSDPIGEFRVMKDELFALDLRKKSTKKN
jgi:hypothetical protein